MYKHAQSAQPIPPTVIRGESPLQGEILIDTVSFSIPLASMADYVGGSLSMFDQTTDQVLALFNIFLNSCFGSGTFNGSELKGPRNFFDHSIPLDNSAGFIAFGGNNTVQTYDSDKTRLVDERIQLYISGEGCHKVKDWGRVANLIEVMGGRITRCDIAYDDHAGINDVDKCRRLYDAGEFTSSGRPPSVNYIDDLGTGSGRTFYVGKRQNGKMLRCYDKGKQLGDKNSDWVRWEVELHAKDRVIPFDVLTEPQEYLAGSYPALSFISSVVQTIKTAKIKLSIQYTKLRNICRVQYGKLLNFAHLRIGLTPEQTFYELLNPQGFPDRIAWAAQN